MNAAKLGGPVVDKAGQVVGLVVGDTVQASTIVPLEKLRAYVVPKPAGLTAAQAVVRAVAWPQSAIVPELLVATHTAGGARSQKLLGNYLTLENRHDFAALAGSVYSKRLVRVDHAGEGPAQPPDVVLLRPEDHRGRPGTPRTARTPG